MTAAEKLRIARQLEKLRVDIIEAGFPAASEGDSEAVKLVAKEISDSRICALARANPGDVAKAAEAVRNANAPRIHTFIATSPIHMKAKLRMSPEDVLEKAVQAVRQARDAVEDVEFSAEDAGRSDEDFLCRIFEAVIDAGARTVNIPDTVGYTMPDQFGEMFGRLMNRIPMQTRRSFRCIATMISESLSPIHSLLFKRALGRWNARLTDWANVLATLLWKRWLWRFVPGRMSSHATPPLIPSKFCQPVGWCPA
jgi:isopropylmalate/homocitrate/citramalate synthase